MRRWRWHPRVIVPVVIVVAGVAIAVGLTTGGSSQSFGLLQRSDDAFEGYTLYGPLDTSDTYLIDMDGESVHHWPGAERPGNSVYLLPNGRLLRTEKSSRPVFVEGRGRGGVVKELDWDGNVTWRFEYADQEHLQHHDVEPLPNGNLLLLAWERHSADDAVAMGRAPELLKRADFWSEEVVEVDRATKEIVWRWRVWDHLVQDRDPMKPNYGSVADQPGRVDINFPGGARDWLHANSLAYSAELDQIVISTRRPSEIWIIDHSVPTEEGSGPAGDLLFRWGNPAVYGRGSAVDQQLFGQHDAEWIPADGPGAGQLLVFNNGSVSTRPYSSVDEIEAAYRNGEYARTVDGTYAPERAKRVHPHRKGDRWLSDAISGSQRLPNGNTLIVDGTAGRIFEVSPAGELVWEFVNPYYDTDASSAATTDGDATIPWRVFNAERYAPDYAGLRRLRD